VYSSRGSDELIEQVDAPTAANKNHKSNLQNLALVQINIRKIVPQEASHYIKQTM
jgi:hypothetical protein